MQLTPEDLPVGSTHSDDQHGTDEKSKSCSDGTIGGLVTMIPADHFIVQFGIVEVMPNSCGYTEDECSHNGGWHFPVNHVVRW